MSLDTIATYPRLSLLLACTLVIVLFRLLFNALGRDDRRSEFNDELTSVRHDHERAYRQHLADINDYRKRGVR